MINNKKEISLAKEAMDKQEVSVSIICCNSIKMFMRTELENVEVDLNLNTLEIPNVNAKGGKQA